MNQTANLSAQELARQLDENQTVRVIDIREGDAYAAGHIPGALNIPVLRLEYKPGFVPDDLPIIVCGSGDPDEPDQSEEAVATLKEFGMQASILEGGIAGWVKAGYAVEVE